jgi:hypothetical protein
MVTQNRNRWAHNPKEINHINKILEPQYKDIKDIVPSVPYTIPVLAFLDTQVEVDGYLSHNLIEENKLFLTRLSFKPKQG